MRRSAGSSSAEGEPPELVLFLDEDTSTLRAVRALREAGASVEIHRDHFPPGTPDANWLPVIGRRGWVLVGRDKGQQRRPIELRALREHKVRKFTLVGSHLRGDEIATALVAAWPRLRRLCAEGTAPLLGKIYRDGRVEVVEPL